MSSHYYRQYKVIPTKPSKFGHDKIAPVSRQVVYNGKPATLSREGSKLYVSCDGQVMFTKTWPSEAKARAIFCEITEKIFVHWDKVGTDQDVSQVKTAAVA